MKIIATTVVTLIIGFSLVGCSNRESVNSEKETTTVASATTTTAPTTTITTTTTPAVTTTAPVTTTEITTTAPVTTAEATTTPETTTTSAETTTPVTTKTDPFVDKRRECLNVKNILQLPEFPSGSAPVSGSMLLQYYGFEVDKLTLFKYIPIDKEPKEDGTWGNPWKVFVGDPTTFKYGCYSPVIKDAIEAYWEETKAEGYEVIDLLGSEFTDLYAEIDSGNPVIIWTNEFMNPVNDKESWKLEDGSTFNGSTEMNCVVLIGYDTTEDTVIVNDPFIPKGEMMEYPRESVELVYNQMEKQALTIHPK